MLKGPKITLEVMSKNARARRRNQESLESHVGRITHVALNNKGISNLDGLQFMPLKVCTVLYLYDNTIGQIEALHNITQLQDLYLQNNNIEEITGLQSNVNLEALHLDNNCISHLSGLHKNQRLHELKLAGQRIPEDVVFTFDIPTLEAISWSLVHLDISCCRVLDPRPLSILRSLQKLDISDNIIEEGEAMSDTLPHLQELQDLCAKGNPIARLQKYRQNTIVCCDQLLILDNKEVSSKERQYLVHVKRRMAAIAMQVQQPVEEMTCQSPHTIHEVSLQDETGIGDAMPPPNDACDEGPQ